MDSITQITLGAAVGEVVLGKKVGNRAMLWGAVAGTIPDLDVFANLVVNELDALAFHRGFTHSITFAFLGAIIFGWLVHRFYKFKYQRIVGFFSWLIFIALVLFIVNSSVSQESFNTKTFLISIAIFLLFLFWKNKKYFVNPRPAPGVSAQSWMSLFFWALVTHPLLDSFTAFGTQLFSPFSSYRVGFNNISVADPFYSVPFLLLVLFASFFHRADKWRTRLTWAGIFISSLYMLWTFSNKFKVDQIALDTAKEQSLSYQRYMTSPTILNNWLWYASFESDTAFHYGLYSFFDKEKKFKLNSIPKNYELLEAKEDDHTIKTLDWFSNGYYSVMRRKDGRLQLNDLRYGTFRGDRGSEDDFVFRFIVEKGDDGYYRLVEGEGGPPDNADRGPMMRQLIQRVKGI